MSKNRNLSDQERQLCTTALEICPTVNLKRASRAMNKFYDDALQEIALSCGQLVILLAVARDGPTTYAHLSRELVLDMTAVGRAVKPLAARRLVSINSAPGSRRKMVKITETGVACLRKAVPLWQEATNQFLEGFGEREWSRLRKELSRTSKFVP